MQDTINYIADDTQEPVVLPNEAMDKKTDASSLLAVTLARLTKEYNGKGYRINEQGFIGLTVDESFTPNAVPEGWLHDDKNSMIIPDSSEAGKQAHDKFNHIAELVIAARTDGFTPNAGDMTTQTTTTRPTTTGRGDKPVLKEP